MKSSTKRGRRRNSTNTKKQKTKKDSKQAYACLLALACIRLLAYARLRLLSPACLCTLACLCLLAYACPLTLAGLRLLACAQVLTLACVRLLAYACVLALACLRFLAYAFLRTPACLRVLACARLHTLACLRSLGFLSRLLGAALSVGPPPKKTSMLTCILLSSRTWGALSRPTLKCRGRGLGVEMMSQSRCSRMPRTACIISSGCLAGCSQAASGLASSMLIL